MEHTDGRKHRAAARAWLLGNRIWYMRGSGVLQDRGSSSEVRSESSGVMRTNPRMCVRWRSLPRRELTEDDEPRRDNEREVESGAKQIEIWAREQELVLQVK